MSHGREKHGVLIMRHHHRQRVHRNLALRKPPCPIDGLHPDSLNLGNRDILCPATIAPEDELAIEGEIFRHRRPARKQGEGTGEPRYEKAVAWYQVAARGGHVGALRQLAGMFADGRGVDEDKVQAWTLLNIAAERGDKEAVAKRDALAADLRPGQLAAGERRTQKLAPKYQGS